MANHCVVNILLLAYICVITLNVAWSFYLSVWSSKLFFSSCRGRAVQVPFVLDATNGSTLQLIVIQRAYNALSNFTQCASPLKNYYQSGYQGFILNEKQALLSMKNELRNENPAIIIFQSIQNPLNAEALFTESVELKQSVLYVHFVDF